MPTPENLKEVKFKLIVFFIVAIVILCFVAWYYYYWFNDVPMTANSSAWGAFGDYWGGILNPIFALMAFAGLLWSIYQNQINLYKTSESFERSMRLAEQQEDRQAKQDKKDDIFRIMEVIYKDINQLTDIKLEYSVTQPGSIITRKASLAIIVKTECSNDEIAQLQKEFYKLFTLISNKLITLKLYLEKFDFISGDSIVTDYYRNYYQDLAGFFVKLSILPNDCGDFYRLPFDDRMSLRE